MGRKFTIRGKTYSGSDDLPAEIKALLEDSNARDLPELMELMEEMSDESFDALLKGLPGSNHYPTYIHKQNDGGMFPETKPLNIEGGERPVSIQEEIEEMRRSAKVEPEKKDVNQQLLLEPEGEEQEETPSEMRPLPLDIEEEDEQHGTSFNVVSRRKVFSKNLSLDLSEESYSEEEDEPENERHVKLDTSLIHITCRCGFKRNVLPEDYREGLRCPHCFRPLKRDG